MSEQLPGDVPYPKLINPMNERLLNRLERIGEALGVNLREEFGSQIMPFVDDDDAMVSRDDFMTVVRNISLRPEALLEWNDDYFEEQFEETVRIARERGSHDND